MRLAARALRCLAVAFGVGLAYVSLSIFAHRWSLWYLALLALLVLPYSFALGRSFGRRCAAFGLVACILAVSPVDVVFTLRRGLAVRLSRASYGVVCDSEACYGCSPSLHRARWAVILAL
jgi:hypothetical protein